MSDDIRALFAAYATGVATVDEQREVEQYLQDHPEARTELASFAVISSRLADTVDQHEPPAGALAGIHARLGMVSTPEPSRESAVEQRVAELPAAPQTVARMPWWRSSWASGGFAAAAMAASTIAIVVGVSNQQLRTDLRDAERSRTGIEQRLSGLERDVAALPSSVKTTSFATSGEFRDVANMEMNIKGHAVLVLQNVPKPRAGRTWQIWHQHENGQVTTLGPMKRVDDVMYIPLGDTKAAQVVALMITDEPANGSAAPTGSTVLEGTVV